MATPDRSPLLPAAFPSSQAGLAGARNNAGSRTDLQHAVPNHHLSPVAPRPAHPLAGPFPGHPATTSISPRLSQKKSFHEPAMSSQSATHSPVPSAGPAPNSSGPAQFRRSHQNGVTSMSSLPGSPINNNNSNGGGGAQPSYPSGGARRPSVMSTPRSSIPGPGSGLTPSMNNGMLTPDWSRTRGMSQQGLQGFQGPANVTPSSLAAQRLFHATGGPPHYPLGAMNPSLAAAASMSLPNLAALSLSPSLNAAAAAHAAAMHGTPSLISSPIIDTQDLHQMMMMQQNAIFGSPGSGLDLATFEQFQAMHQQQQQQQISSPLSNFQSPSLGGPSPNNRKLGLYKTELCRSWEEKGSCRYGTKCQFAHGPDELRAIPRHSKYKTEICRTFWLSGSCPYGRRCCFVHSTVPASGTAANVQASPNEFYTPQFGSEQPAEIIKLGDVVSANIKKSQQEEDPKKAALVGLGFEVPYSSEAEGAKIASGAATPGTNLRSALSVPTNLSSFAQAANMSAHKRFNEMLKADNDLLKADPFPAASSMGADQTPALSPAVSPKLGGPAPAKSETNEASIAATEASYPSPKDGQLRPPTPQPSRSLTSSPLLSSPAKRDAGNKLMGSPSLWGTDKKVW